MRISLRLTTAALAVGLLLSGCGNAADRETSNDSEFPHQIALDDGYNPDAEFRYGYNSYPASWDPIESVTGADLIWYAPVYDRLLWVDEAGDLEPMLATAYTPSADNTSMTLELREGLAFSDGTPFNAEAVKFNLDRARADGSTISNEVAQITNVEVIAPLTVQINVDGGLGALVTALAARPGMMVSPAAAQAGTLQTAPTGVGPYVTTEIEPGGHVSYKKSDGYWDPEAQRVATRTYQVFADDQARLNALQSGEIDGANLSLDLADNAHDAGLVVTSRPTDLFLALTLNSSLDVLDNPDVMKAINMAVDRVGIAEGLNEGLCVPQIQPFGENSPGYSKKVGDGLDIFPYDPEAAKELLTDAGVTDLHLTGINPASGIYVKFAEVLQDNLKAVGIDLTVSGVPNAQIMQEFVVANTADALAAPYTGIADPDGVVGRYLVPDGLYNQGGVQYDELLKFAAEGAASTDPAERNAAYEKMIDAWIEAPPHVVPVCMIHLAAGFNKNVSGVLQTAGGVTDLLRGVAVSDD